MKGQLGKKRLSKERSEKFSFFNFKLEFKMVTRQPGRNPTGAGDMRAILKKAGEAGERHWCSNGGSLFPRKKAQKQCCDSRGLSPVASLPTSGNRKTKKRAKPVLRCGINRKRPFQISMGGQQCKKFQE